MKPLLALAALALAALALAPLAQADETISYVGNTLDQQGSHVNQALCECNITGTMDFAQPLELPADIEDTTGTPESYSFSVDGFTLNQTNSTVQQFLIGDLTWSLDLLGANGLTISIQCQDGCGDGGGATDWAGFGSDAIGSGIGITVGNRGTWTVPEASSFLLLAVGIAAIALKRKVA